MQYNTLQILYGDGEVYPQVNGDSVAMLNKLVNSGRQNAVHYAM